MQTLIQEQEVEVRTESDIQFDKVIKRLETMNPWDFDMDNWSACIAGITLQENGYRFSYENGYIISPIGLLVEFESIEYIAENLLGIKNKYQTERLFCFFFWPKIDGEPMFSNTPAGAIERIKYFRETGL